MKKSDLAKLALAGLVTGGMGLGCEKSGTGGGGAAILSAQNLDDFKAECAKMSGTYMHQPGSKQNTCAGYTFRGPGDVVKNSCHTEPTGTDHCQTPM